MLRSHLYKNFSLSYSWIFFDNLHVKRREEIGVNIICIQTKTGATNIMSWMQWRKEPLRFLVTGSGVRLHLHKDIPLALIPDWKWRWIKESGTHFHTSFSSVVVSGNIVLDRFHAHLLVGPGDGSRNFY